MHEHDRTVGQPWSLFSLSDKALAHRGWRYEPPAAFITGQTAMVRPQASPPPQGCLREVEEVIQATTYLGASRTVSAESK